MNEACEISVPGTYQGIDANPQGFDDVMGALSGASVSDTDIDVVNDFDTVLFVLIPGDTGTRIKEWNRGK